MLFLCKQLKYNSNYNIIKDIFVGDIMGIIINNLNYKNIFKNLDLEINDKEFITIIGSSASGKTTLVNFLSKKIESDNVTIDYKKEEISVVFDDIDSNFIYDTVIENLVFPLENLNYSKEEIDHKLNKIIKYLKIEELLNSNINTLSGGEKELIVIASALITEPKLLILDEPFIMLDNIQKEKIFKLLKKINRELKTTIIYLTNDTESIIYGKTIGVITNKQITKGNLKDILKNEKLFKNAKQKLPFMADLSLKLKYYDLIDDIILDESKMVDVLWK